MFVSVRRPESLSLSLAVLASLSEVIMDQIPLEYSVPKVREVVANRVGIRIVPRSESGYWSFPKPFLSPATRDRI